MSPVHVTIVLAGVVVVLHPFLPADVAAFSVGTSIAYSLADAIVLGDCSSRRREGRIMDDDRKLRLDDAAAAAAATSVRSSTLLFDVALSRMPVRAFGEKCDEVHALTELNDVNPINSNVDSFIILKSIFL